MLTIVPREKIDKNPETLLFHFPSIHPVQYTKMHAEYYKWKAIQAAESTAAACGFALVPSDCFHWRRKSNMSKRRVKIGKQSFFTLKINELSESEYLKYQYHCVEKYTDIRAAVQ